MSERDTEEALAPDEEAPDEAPAEETAQDAGGEQETKETGELARERDELYDRLLRKEAELQNYRKRVAREKEELRVLVRSEMIRELLLVLDAGEKGLETIRQEADEHDLDSYRDGFELLVRQLEKMLDRYGVHPVPGVGFEFDPRYHEAVASEVNDEHPDGCILEEFRRGYLIGDHLVRPSQVKVAVADSGETEPASDE